jgi:cellulose synthase/poly-beta-1,6-N-acetylglucosamine synthase-like glycosyltransferase/peptidoglycan/xylan/chitin deacetylase (PgdA/CDA1 family)
MGRKEGTTAGPAGAPVFLDSSGHRWRRVRIVVTALVVLLTGSGILAFVRMDTPPTTMGNAHLSEVTSKQTTLHPPVIGSGPLIRVLEIKNDHGKSVGYDPFTHAMAATLTDAEVTAAHGHRFVVQKFGYSETAQKTISLTFDDGPDPKYTTELLDMLSAAHVPATFFVIGSAAAKYPGLVARESHEGHAVGNHSLTHIDVADSAGWRTRIELVATDRVLRSTTGMEASYFRLPYEGEDDESIQAAITGLLRAQKLGYLVVSHDVSTNDWKYEDTQHSGAIPLPALDGRNATLLLHDGGGNRQKTVDLVKRLIPYARGLGYTFQSMPQVQPALAQRTSTVRPTFWDRVTLALVTVCYVWPAHLLQTLFMFALLMVGIVGFGGCVLAGCRRTRRRDAFPAAEEIDLPVSVLLAAYNEERVIRRTIETILASDYPFIEVLIIDDGSTDGTSTIVRELMATDPRIRLVNQPNAGKSTALNHGLSLVEGSHVVTLDADTILTPTTITNLVRHFAVDTAGTLGAVAAVLRVGNRERNLLTRWQALEYLTQIGVERAAHDALGAISIIPGACAAWRKDAILAAGGYSTMTLAEDCDLSLSLHRAGWRVTQDDHALAFTEVPENVDGLLAQRTRWTYGTLQATYKHRDMLFRPRYGWLGSYVLPNYVLSIAVPIVFQPFTVAMVIMAIQTQGWGIVGVYFAIFLAVHLGVTAVSIALMRESWHHMLLVPLYRVIYEPLRTYLLYTSAYLAVRGVRMGWNKIARSGSVDASLAAASAGTGVTSERIIP